MKFTSVIFVLLFTLQISAQQVNISGTVTDFNFISPLQNTSVVVKDNNTSEILGTDTTDSNGNYTITIIIDDVNDPSLPDDFYLSRAFPNPYNPATNLLFSVPLSGSYTISIYNILGERFYTQEFSLEPGSYKFNVSGLGSAGVYLFNISGNDFTQTEKLMLLDGGKRNVNVILSSGSNYLSKKLDNELLVEFSRTGYEDKDSVINILPNITLDAELSQIPTQDTIDFHSEFTLLPTSQPGENLDVTELDGYFSGTTNTNGTYDASANVSFIFDPANPSNRIYNPSSFNVSVTGSNVQQKDTSFVIDGSNLNWTSTITQLPIQKQAYAFGAVTDENDGLGNALVELFDAGTNQFKDSVRSLSNGFWESDYFYQGYEYDDNDLYALIDSVRFEFSAVNHESRVKTEVFSNVLEVNVFLPTIPPPVYDFTIHFFDVNGNVISNSDITITWLDSTITYSNNNGVISISKGLYNVASTDSAELWHTNQTDYLHWTIARTYELNQYDKEPIFQNVDWNSNAYFNIAQIDSLDNIYIFAIPRTVSYSGGTLQTDEAPYTTMMNRDPGFVIHSKPYPGIPNQRWVQLEENGTTGDPIPVDQLDRALEKFQYVFAACTLSNGVITQVNEPIQRLSINSPEWQQYVNEEFKNLHYTYFANVPPGNNVTWTIDPDLRIYNSFSQYPTSETDGVILSETHAQIANTSSSPTYVSDLNTGQLTETGLTMLRTNKLMRTWTQYYPTSNKPEKKEFKENTLYTTTSTYDSEGQRIIYTVMEENK